ncbi:hypothetical protein HK099_002847, partial [Clydaea vesicula]
MIFYSGRSMFDLQGRGNLQCFNKVTTNNQLTSNSCAAQVFKSLWLTSRKWLMHISWPISIGLALAIYFVEGYGFETLSACFVNRKWINLFFYVPLGIFSVATAIMFIWTLVYIVGVQTKISTEKSSLSIETGKSTSKGKIAAKTIKSQWRMIFFILVCMTSFIYFLIFNFVFKTETLTIGAGTVWLQEWLGCVAATTEGGQNVCSSISAKHLPPYAVLIIYDLLIDLLPIWMFIIFGMRLSLYRDWA